MAHPIVPPITRKAGRLLFAAAFVLALFTNPFTASPATALAAAPGPAPAENGKADPAADMDVKELKERLRVLGEAIRDVIEGPQDAWP
jgi:hypothetical protein